MGYLVIDPEVIIPWVSYVLLQAEEPSTAIDPQQDLFYCRADGMLRLEICSDSSWQSDPGRFPGAG